MCELVFTFENKIPAPILNKSEKKFLKASERKCPHCMLSEQAQSLQLVVSVYTPFEVLYLRFPKKKYLWFFFVSMNSNKAI